MIQPMLFDFPEPPEVEGISIVQTSVAAHLAAAGDASVDLVIADPPWLYQNNSGRAGSKTAEEHYDCMDIAGIVADLAAAYRVARPNTYLLCWATFPTLFELAAEMALLAAREGKAPPRTARGALKRLQAAIGWRPLSGGAWTKWLPDGTPVEPGIGFHWRGDVEPLLLFAKGKPRPQGFVRNACVSTKTAMHSEKPVHWTAELLEALCIPGGEVLELYGGTCPAARAARQTGRRCTSVELDAERAAIARSLLAQHRVAA